MTLVRHCINAIQMLCVCWVYSLPLFPTTGVTLMPDGVTMVGVTTLIPPACVALGVLVVVVLILDVAAAAAANAAIPVICP